MLKFVEDLLQGAPVEWKKLGEICDFRHGFSFKASLFKKVGDPVIRIMNIHDDRVTLENLTYFDRTDYTTDLAPWRVQKGDILIAMSGATTGKIGFVDDDIPAYINQRVGKFIPNRACLNNRYLFYFLANEMQTIYEMAHGGAQPNLSSSALLDNLLIPLPPLHVQGKIVAVLDKFTALERELKTKLGTEFVLRRKQYEYYRNKLLTFGEEVEWKKLGEILAYEQPAKYIVHSSKYKDCHSIPVLTAGQSFILGYTNETDGIYDASPQKPVIIFDDFTTLFHWVDFPFKVKSSAMKFLSPIDATSINFRFVFYAMHCIRMEIIGHQRQWIANFSMQYIPLPPLPVQEKIVSILDKFHTLTNSLTEGLPREIALRHKQYEYYRDQLFAFPRPQ